MTGTVTDIAAHRPTPANGPLHVLRIDASAKAEGSTTRQLADETIDRLRATHGEIALTVRDLSQGVPLLSPDWIGANFTPEEERTEAQRGALALSDTLVAELQAADVVVIGVPVYNFGIPAALKAWIDQIARARVTFRYTEDGPVGLLQGKKAYLLAASGGTGLGSEIDFATPYMRHILGFVGITDVTVIGAGQQLLDAEAAKAQAERDLEAALPLSAA